MVEYKEMYYIMYRGVENARQILLKGSPSFDTLRKAAQVLEEAQQDSDDVFIKAAEVR